MNNYTVVISCYIFSKKFYHKFAVKAPTLSEAKAKLLKFAKDFYDNVELVDIERNV
jgi:hypothetical protein